MLLFYHIMKLITRISHHVSLPVLSAELNLPLTTLRQVSEERAYPSVRRTVNKALKKFEKTGFYHQAVGFEKKITVTNVEQLPIVKHRKQHEARVFRKKEEKAKSKKTGMSVDAIHAVIDMAAYSQKRVFKMRDMYAAARDLARKTYASLHYVDETWDDYLRRMTRKEYKALSNAIGDQRSMEKNKKWKRLRSLDVVEWDIDRGIT